MVSINSSHLKDQIYAGLIKIYYLIFEIFDFKARIFIKNNYFEKSCLEIGGAKNMGPSLKLMINQVISCMWSSRSYSQIKYSEPKFMPVI